MTATKVFHALMELEGDFVIEQKVRPENRELFIEVVKWLIDNDLGRVKGCYFEFSNDYSRIRKVKYLKPCERK